MLTEILAEPAGYLQWNDVDIRAQRLVHTSETSQSATKPTQDMMALMSKPRDSSAFKYVPTIFPLHQCIPCLGFSYKGIPPRFDQRCLTSGKFSSWMAQLGNVLAQQGLEAVRFERCTISDPNKMWWGLSCCMLCEEYCDGLERDSGDPDDAVKIQNHREAIAGAAIAAQHGVVVCSSLVMALGRKAF